VVGSANFILQAGANILVELSPVQRTVLKVSISTDAPERSSTDLVLLYRDQEALLEPLLGSGNTSQWEVWA
jgi:hypothetical protein